MSVMLNPHEEARNRGKTPTLFLMLLKSEWLKVFSG